MPVSIWAAGQLGPNNTSFRCEGAQPFGKLAFQLAVFGPSAPKETLNQDVTIEQLAAISFKVGLGATSGALIMTWTSGLVWDHYMMFIINH